MYAITYSNPISVPDVEGIEIVQVHADGQHFADIEKATVADSSVYQLVRNGITVGPLSRDEVKMHVIFAAALAFIGAWDQQQAESVDGFDQPTLDDLLA